MRLMLKTVDGQTHNTVTIDSKGVVVAVLHGKQTAESIRELGQQMAKHIADLRSQGKRVLLVTDLRAIKVSDSTPAARVEAKSLTKLRADASVILAKRGLAGIVLYIARSGSNGSTSRVYTDEKKARKWLEGKSNPRPGKPATSLIGGVLVAAIGLSVLVGWQINSPLLTTWLTFLRPMDPRSAVGLLAIGFGFCCYWFGKLRPLKFAGGFGVLIGTAALVPGHMDLLLLYGAKVRAAGLHGQVADSAAICFIALGLSPFTIQMKSWWRRPLQYLIAGIILGLSLFNIFGQMYAREFVYGLNDTFVMSFNLAVAFAVSGVVMVLLVLYRKYGTGILGQVNRLGWLLVVILLAVQVATFGAWLPAVDRNKANSRQAFDNRVGELQAGVAGREGAYVNALYGFRGLFAASDYVDQGEFEAYYDSLNLAKTYPGLRALSFISKVSEKDLPAFVARHKADTSLHAQGNPAFAITGKAPGSSHYIVTYVVDSNTVGGSDLASQPSRLQAFQRAEASGKPVSSGTIHFAANATTPAQDGFFMTTPVNGKTDRSVVTGFVNAVFNYKDFFAQSFSGNNRLKSLALTVTDTADKSVVYMAGMPPSGNDILASDVSVPVADHTWNLHFSAPPNYGVNANQANLPLLILVGGQLFTVLLAVMFVMLLRSRREGFLLADSITQDLQYERNLAVANSQKNSAILASIGDAVFAVDTKLRIQLFNPAAQRISGFSQDEALDRPYDEVLKFEHEKTGAVNKRFIYEALSGKVSAMANHTVLIRKDGLRVPVADSAAPIIDAAGKIQGAIVVFRDVSKDYELDKAKSEFVSLASHQLRTPLSAINWYGEMLLNGDAGKLNKAQRSYIDEIFDGNQRMIELVNSLLDVSRLEVGKMVSKPEPIDVGSLIASMEKELTVSIRGKHLALTRDIHRMPPVIADPKQLRMVVQNLMSNAVKYTPEKGEVHVVLRRATPADMRAAKLKSTEPHWFFSIKDTGYGIPKDQQSKIFGKLFRADNVRTLNVDGTGLGLYIVKQVVGKLGGRVWFESVESIGTTFNVVLPMQNGKAKVAP